MDLIDIIEETKVVPVIVFNNTSEVEPTLTALCNGQIKIAEICFRTDCASECIKIAIDKFPDMAIGAGTVINETQCKEAIALGVKFIVSPGLSEEIANICKQHNIPYFPGTITPTEIMRAVNLGITRVKFFPASVYGGLKAIKSLSSVFPSVKFMPTGGVNEDNLKEFLNCKSIFACGGSWITKGTPEEITQNCLKIKSIVKGEN